MSAMQVNKISVNSAPCGTPVLDPGASVFVSANAGAGKTTLLTNRVLSLLLHGVAPGRILCLTFTKAAAAEMSNRVQAALGGWVMADGEKLAASLAQLLGHAPDAEMLKRARRLFAEVLEAPEGVRIQTIHAFCQTLLARFPIEAGVSPHFSIMDERSEKEMLKEARLRLLSGAQDHEPPVDGVIAALAGRLSESSFEELLQEVVAGKRRLQSALQYPGGAEGAAEALWQQAGLSPEDTRESLFAECFSYDGATLAGLRKIAGTLSQGGKTDSETAQILGVWLENPGYARVDEYIPLFVTGDNAPRKKLFTKNALDATLADVLQAEQERVLRFHRASLSLDLVRTSAHVLQVAEALLAIYGKLKVAHAAMDYDDLITTASRLLSHPGVSAWVLFKLDGGIDHVLVDEAQDTNPEQWAIVKAVTEDFFAGAGRREGARSLFVVGDEKQSIFSFQGADVRALASMQAFFMERIEGAGMPIYRESLTRSYRSAPSVLQAVDAVFAPTEMRAGVTFDNAAIAHEPTRVSHAGLVELWPVLKPGENDYASPKTLLARKLAKDIRRWLDDGMQLAARGRALQPGDIMILVRRRTSLVDALVRALKREGVPVAGLDRMMLGENLAVRDLVALGEVLLLPEDDLTLASLLKSPIVNMSEEALFALAHGRGETSLWDRLREFSARASVYGEAYALLADLRGRADTMPPYELYGYVLDTLGMRQRFIGRMGGEYHDPIDEFLSQALVYERGNVASLQGFLHWLAASDSQIKRDMDQARGSVRVMTVHGAKGLQAPVVILPDTTTSRAPSKQLLWPQERDGVPLWSPSSKRDDAHASSLRQVQQDMAMAEERRLLYVALTRAEDCMVICGATGKASPDKDSWYDMVEAHLAPLMTPFEHGLRLGDAMKPGPRATVVAAKETKEDLSFLSRPVPQEPELARPLSPSRPQDEAPPAASPLAGEKVHARGVLIHRLLQRLPDVAPDRRETVARHLAKAQAKVLPPDAIEECIREATALMDDTRFAFLFATGALAEAPVSGTVQIGNKHFHVAGQVDRLVVTDKEIWVIDYKTRRLPPAKASDAPPAYLRQMGLYRLLLKAIYPGKAVRAALLWTASCRLDVLSDALLDEAAGSF
jgi:ATP-dependent helicase/nuclease subunit A